MFLAIIDKGISKSNLKMSRRDVCEKNPKTDKLCISQNSNLQLLTIF